MPIAQYEIAKDKKLKQPIAMEPYPPGEAAADIRMYDKDDPARAHIMPMSMSARGSTMWLAIDHRGPTQRWIERREVADRILAMAKEIEPAGLLEARLAREKAEADSASEMIAYSAATNPALE